MTRCKVIDYGKGVRWVKAKGDVREPAWNLLRDMIEGKMELFTIHASKGRRPVENAGYQSDADRGKGEHPSYNRIGRAHRGLRRQAVWSEKLQ